MRCCVLLFAACATSPKPDVATGELDAWQTSAPLPVARANHCAAVIDDWILVIGGNHASGSGFVTTDEIDAAQIGLDGSLSAWQIAGHLPSPASECTAVVDGKALVIVDAIYDDSSLQGHVEVATFADGVLGTFAQNGALAEGVFALSSEGVVRGKTMYVMNTRLPSDPNPDTTLTLTAPAAAPSTWTEDVWPGVGFRAQAEYAFTEKYAYTIGGYHDPAVGAVADVFVRPLAGGATVQLASLPTPVAFGEAVAVDDWLYVVGGRAQVFGAGGTPAVYAAPIAADGSLGAWTTSTALPMARTNQVVSLAGDFLVLTGGAASGGGDTTVLTARVRFP